LENSLLPDLLQEKWLSTIEENGKNPSQSSEATSMHTSIKLYFLMKEKTTSLEKDYLGQK